MTQTSIATHVVDTSASFVGYFRQMSAKQTKASLSCFVDKLTTDQSIKNSKYENDIRILTERVNSLPTTGGGGITDERLETLFVKLMQHEKFRQLFLGACQEIDGRLVSNSSIISELMNNPQPVKVFPNYSPVDPTNQIGETWLLPGDRSAVFVLSDERLSDANANPEIRKVSMTCNAYPFYGRTAAAQFYEKYAVYAPVNPCDSPVIVTLERCNLFYDFSGDLTPCPLTGLPDGIDINEDGRIGAPPATNPEGTAPEGNDPAANPEGRAPEGNDPAANPEGAAPEGNDPAANPEGTAPEGNDPAANPEGTAPEGNDPAANPEGTAPEGNDPAANPEGTAPEGNDPAANPEGTAPEGNDPAANPEGTAPEGNDPAANPEGRAPEGNDPAANPEGTAPEGNDPAANPEGTAPEGNDPAANPEGTDPEGNDPATNPEGTAPEGNDPAANPEGAAPEGNDPAANPEGTDPAANP